MIIRNNTTAMNAVYNYKKNTTNISKNLEKLSSGYKINSAGDDAAGEAVHEKMRSQILGLDKSQDNVKDGIGLIKTAEAALQETHDMLHRMEELATQSANGTYDDGVDRKILQKEVDELLSEVDRIANSTHFNRIDLLNGTGSITLQIGDTSDQFATIQFEDMTVNGLALNSVDISTLPGAQDAIETVNEAVNKVSTFRAYLGAHHNRLAHTYDNLAAMEDNVQAAESIIVDTDMAEEMMGYTANSILVQSSQSMSAHANQLPEHVLSLLQ